MGRRDHDQFPHLGIIEIGQEQYREHVAKMQGRTQLVTPEDAAIATRVRDR